MGCHISFITGMMLGFELADVDGYSYLVIDLFIIQFLFEWEN
jgi:hypothetical protein